MTAGTELGLPELYRHMARSRAFELAVEDLWERGLISGEMHLATGEEAIAAGVVSLLREGDGLSLTHRCSAGLVVRGVSLESMLREMLGHEDGLSRGRGGHMHLMSRAHLAVSSGIVGASLPAGAGFALAAQRLRGRAVAVAFIGDGALNQGMALETLNLAVAWKLPLLIVCVDNGWAITTTAGTVTGGELVDRAAAFGLTVQSADGTDVEEVHRVAGDLLQRCRAGKGPAFLYARCPRLDGHFLGDPLLAQSRNLTGSDARQTVGDVLSAASSSSGGSLLERAGSALRMVGVMAKARLGAERDHRGDPMVIARDAMAKHPGDLAQIDRDVTLEMTSAVDAALRGAP